MYDLIIIGAGPSGIACGIEAKKAGLNYCILEKGNLVNSIYNFPTNMTFFSTSKKLEIGEIPFISHNDKPTRKEALEYYRRIASSFDLNIKYRQQVEQVSKDGDHFTISITTGSPYRARFVILATGYYDRPRMLNIPGEDLPKVKHYYDDAHPYIGMNVVVIGAANSACDVALETWQKGANVTMVVREDQLYQKVKYWILPNIENRIKEGSIQAFFNTNVVEIKEHSVTIQNDEGRQEIANDYVLAMTGYMPDYELMERIGLSLISGDAKKPLCNEDTLESSIKGLYLSGVVISGLETSKLFIENTRHHGEKIINSIMKQINS